MALTEAYAQARPPRRPLGLGIALAAIATLVLVAHLFTLDWLAGLAQSQAGLREMPEPMFTRVLEPDDPEPVVVAVPAPVPAPARREEMIVAAAPVPAPVASAPVEAASAPGNKSPQAASPSEPSAAPAEEPPARTAASPAPPAPAPADAAAAAGTVSPPASSGLLASTAPGAAPGAASAPTAAASAPTPPGTDPFAGVWPTDTRVTYKLSGQFRGGPLYGSARVQWLRQGAQYQARVELSITPFGGAAFTSQGTVTPTGLVPQAFEEARGSRRRVTRFEGQEVVLHDGRSFPKPEGVQDMASQFLELGHRFRTGQAATTLGSTISLPLVRPGSVDTWTYDVFARELLPTPRLGELEVVRVTPWPFTNARGTLASEIWFAPRLQYLPVRFRVSFGEEALVDLLVETIEQR